jgi:uncharacterized protein YecE (DUF72 family)
MTARIKVGVTSWADRSLVTSGWYPPAAHTPEARLRYYASRFSLVENDSAYYALPSREVVQHWAERTPPGFTMNVKAHALLTGHYSDPRRLPPDLRAALPASVRERPRLYPRHVGSELMDELGRRFKAAIAPLFEHGRLGVVLFQFPVWFPISSEAKLTLARIRRGFAPYRIAIEFRNLTWMSARNRGETLALLRGLDLIYACVDEPQGFVSSVPPIAAATADLALVRLHGRNAARWRRSVRTAAERFDYLYSNEELGQWVPRVHELAQRTREVHVLFNNCHEDNAVRNAHTMAALLAAQPEAQVVAPYIRRRRAPGSAGRSPAR